MVDKYRFYMETDRIIYLDTTSIIACHSTEIASEWEIKSPSEETAGLDSLVSTLHSSITALLRNCTVE